MRIIKNIENPTAKFEDLMIGDVFLLAKDESVCMKIPKVYNDCSGTIYYHEVNAYDLENNEFFWLDKDDEVRPLNAYMEVK
jgi:hypothetical protein